MMHNDPTRLRLVVVVDNGVLRRQLLQNRRYQERRTPFWRAVDTCTGRTEQNWRQIYIFWHWILA